MAGHCSQTGLGPVFLQRFLIVYCDVFDKQSSTVMYTKYVTGITCWAHSKECNQGPHVAYGTWVCKRWRKYMSATTVKFTFGAAVCVQYTVQYNACGCCLIVFEFFIQQFLRMLNQWDRAVCAAYTPQWNYGKDLCGETQKACIASPAALTVWDPLLSLTQLPSLHFRMVESWC